MPRIGQRRLPALPLRLKWETEKSVIFPQHKADIFLFHCFSEGPLGVPVLCGGQDPCSNSSPKILSLVLNYHFCFTLKATVMQDSFLFENTRLLAGKDKVKSKSTHLQKPCAQFVGLESAAQEGPVGIYHNALQRSNNLSLHSWHDVWHSLNSWNLPPKDEKDSSMMELNSLDQ